MDIRQLENRILDFAVFPMVRKHGVWICTLLVMQVNINAITKKSNTFAENSETTSAVGVNSFLQICFHKNFVWALYNETHSELCDFYCVNIDGIMVEFLWNYFFSSMLQLYSISNEIQISAHVWVTLRGIRGLGREAPARQHTFPSSCGRYRYPALASLQHSE